VPGGSRDDSAPRHRRQEGDLVVGHDWVVADRRFAVHPDTTDGHEQGEVVTESLDRTGDDLVDGCAVDRRGVGSRGLTYRGEQSEPGHVVECRKSVSEASGGREPVSGRRYRALP